ncbi:MAG: prepilin-type N-terminal cleavage/methylation domain-containing protein [Gemmatimonadaceae bacterium]|nr:prepilin-type N-terminal cleavage/methylation domain-containing protein [Gemmatimonadaceae bacterium]
MSTRRAPRRRARRGFTLIELVVAIMIMTVGVLGLASTATVVARQLGGAAQQTIAANVAARRLELLRSRHCTALASGSAVTRGMTEHWGVASAVPIPGGVSVAHVVDTVTYTAADGHVRPPLVFESYVQCD